MMHGYPLQMLGPRIPLFPKRKLICNVIDDTLIRKTLVRLNVRKLKISVVIFLCFFFKKIEEKMESLDTIVEIL